jgi:hypothetical protein
MAAVSNSTNAYVGYLQLKPGVYYYRSNSKGAELGDLGYFVNHIIAPGKYWGKDQSALFTKMPRDSEAFKKISELKSDHRIIEYDKTTGFKTFGGSDFCSEVPEFCENGKVKEDMFTMIPVSETSGYDFYYIATTGGRKPRNKTKRRKTKRSKKLKRRSTKKH